MLQLGGDPRSWPRDLPLDRDTILWRRIARADPREAWPPEDPTERLRGLTHAQLLEAKFWYLCVTYLYVFAALLAAFAFATDESQKRQQLATIGAVSCQILAALARLRAIRLHSLAHEADWRALVMDGLGHIPREERRAIMIENSMSDSARARATRLPRYFANVEPPGETRLLANLRETAFYTCALYRTAANRAVFLAALVIFVPASGPIYSVVTGVAIPSAFAVLAVSSVLPLWDVFARVRSWRNSANTLERASEALAEIDHPREGLSLVTDCVIATATAPPIPRHAYDKWREDLREMWPHLEGEAPLTELGDPATP